jgi:hypothetical protein
LPPGTLDPKGGLTWTLPFATPLAAVHLQAVQDNTLVPVRIQSRADAAQPWRTLASAVVYRLDTVGQGSSNPPTPLHGASVRALRVEASQGAALPSGGLQVTVEFAPLQLAFLASGAGPFTLAVGRSHTSAASVDATLLGSLAPDRLNTLPLATVARVEESPARSVGRRGAGLVTRRHYVAQRAVVACVGLGCFGAGGGRFFADAPIGGPALSGCPTHHGCAGRCPRWVVRDLGWPGSAK